MHATVLKRQLKMQKSGLQIRAKRWHILQKKISAGRVINDNPNNLWKLYNKVVNGNKTNEMRLKEGDETINEKKKESPS